MGDLSDGAIIVEGRKTARDEMEFIETKLNKSLFIAWNRKYIGYLFWNNIGTPINLFITILTAISASSGSGASFITERQNTILQFTVLIISAINTFFRPYVKSNEHIKFIQEIQKFGTEFDSIYYTPKASAVTEDYITFKQKYQELFIRFNKYQSEKSLEHKNLFVDIIYCLMVNTLMRKNESDMEWTKVNYV